MNDLRGLYWHKETNLVSPLEDFATEVLAVAIRHDPTPLLRVLEGIGDGWKPRSGRPSIDVSTVTRAQAQTQTYLSKKGLPGGRLDLVVTLEGAEAPLWIEAKIDAPLTRRLSDGTWVDQLEVYLKHREVTHPEPTILTLTRGAPIRSDVTGISWNALMAAVDSVPNPDRWWQDLKAFLRDEGVIIPAPPEQLVDFESLLPIYEEVNQKMAELWPAAPKNLHWLGPRRLAKAARDCFKRQRPMTGGPLRYGLLPAGEGFEWTVAVATGSDYWNVHVDVDAVIEAALIGNLPDKWSRSLDRDAVLSQRWRFVENASTAAASCMCAALQELHDARVIEPYLQAMQTKLDLEKQRREFKAAESPSEPA